MSQANASTVLLEHHLKQLKLPTILCEYTAIAATCTKNRSAYPTYLLRLTERQLLDRERKAAERRIKEAGFPVVKTLDSFEFSALPALNEPLLRELARGEYIDKHENVLLIGNAAPARPIWPARWASPPALHHRHRPGDAAARVPRTTNPCSASTSSWSVSSCSCWTSLAMCPSPWWAPNCSSRWCPAPIPPPAGHQPAGHHQPAFRGMGRGDGQRAHDRGPAGPPHPPRAYPRGQRGKLPSPPGSHAGLGLC